MSIDIIPGSQWGRRPWARQPATVALSRREAFYVHYHGGAPRHDRGDANAREVDAIHHANGWLGVGYNFLVGQDGQVREGRGWNLVGAHAAGHNTTGIGVYVAVGGNQKPTDAALRSVRALYDEACRRTGRTLTIRGHRDVNATACPGVHLYGFVKSGLAVDTGSGSPGGGSSSGSGSGSAGGGSSTSKPAALKVDGRLGPATIGRWQQAMGTTVDHVISRPSQLVSAVQRRLREAGARDWDGRQLKVDGKGIASNAGGVRYPTGRGRTRTIWALQVYLGTTPDGHFSPTSSAVKALQTRLNEGRF